MPLLARIYPNGIADVNAFHAAGGMAFVIRELLDAGLLHEDVLTVAGQGGLARYREAPFLEDGRLVWREGAKVSRDPHVLRPVAEPFSADGGLSVLTGNLGRAVIKTSAVKPRAPGRRGAGRGLRRPGRAATRRSGAASSTATSSPWSASRARRPTACRSCTS